MALGRGSTRRGPELELPLAEDPVGTAAATVAFAFDCVTEAAADFAALAVELAAG